MDFMGIGFLELLLILVLGVIFIGPDKLPGIVAKAGQLFRSFRKATFDLTKSITEELPTEDMSKTLTQKITTETKAKNAERSQPSSDSNEEAHEQ